MPSRVLCLLLTAAGPDLMGATDWKLWYRQPAARWEEALPVGNGRFGAMIYGGAPHEQIQLTEETVWSGAPKAAKATTLSRVLHERQRRLIFEGKFTEAHELTLAGLRKAGLKEELTEIAGTTATRHAFQTMGDLHFWFSGPKLSPRQYRRELDLDTGIAAVTYLAGDARFTREVFASAPDQVLVIRLTCDRPGRISFDATMDRPADIKDHADRYATDSEFRAVAEMKPPPEARLRGIAPGRAIWTGQADDSGTRFQAHLRALADGGEVLPNENGITVRDANAVTLLVTSGTDYRGADPARVCEQRMAAAARKSYDELRHTHVADHQALFRRVHLDLGTTDNAAFPTDKRLLAFQLDTEDNRARYLERDPQLFALYFQFGRYLLIASARPGTLPPPLQGVWNDSLLPPWFGQHTSDINIQMNHWPVEVANLAECHLPLFDLLESFRKPARQTARLTYGARGLVLHGITNFGPKSPSGNWQDAAGWLADHFWQHYSFSGDRDFLARRAYPFMKDAALFYLDFLVEHPKYKWLVTAPTYSPENQFVAPDSGKRAELSAGVTITLGILSDLFENTIEASKILDVDPQFQAEVARALARLAPYRVDRYGALQEWLEDFDESEPGNRHNSHLYPLFPGKSITVRRTPELARAARKALERRLEHRGGWTGWSRAWLTNAAARLEDGRLAHDQITYLLRRCTFPNLFDTHPRRGGNVSIFQIDGNFGGAAGIAEMLLQSHDGEVNLLPALPPQWRAGEYRGLRARGGFEVDVTWKAGTLQSATIRSRVGGICRLRYRDRTVSLPTERGGVLRLNGALEQL